MWYLCIGNIFTLGSGCIWFLLFRVKIRVSIKLIIIIIYICQGRKRILGDCFIPLFKIKFTFCGNKVGSSSLVPPRFPLPWYCPGGVGPFMLGFSTRFRSSCIPCSFFRTWDTGLFRFVAPTFCGVSPGKVQKPFGDLFSG